MLDFLWKSELFHARLKWLQQFVVQEQKKSTRCIFTHATIHARVPLCQPFIAETELFMKLHSILWCTPALPDHTHIHKHTHGCKCVFWLWKSCLYSFVVSGPRINQITAMAAASPPPAPLTAPSPAHGYRPSRGPGSAGGGPVQSAGCRCCSRSGSVSPKCPRCQKTRHITAGVTLKPTERNVNPWTHHAASHMTLRGRVMSKYSSITPSVAVDTQKCIVYVAIIRI